MRLQIYKTVFVLLAFLLANGAAHAAEGDCFSFETVNNVKLALRSEIPGNRPGLTSRPYRLDINTVQKKCGAFREIVWTNDITIYVSEKLAECQNREVFNHEKKHVGSYLKAFKEMPPWVANYMSAQGKGATEEHLYKDIYARILVLQKNITEMNRYFDWEQYKNPKVTHYVIRACGSIWGR